MGCWRKLCLLSECAKREKFSSWTCYHDDVFLALTYVYTTSGLTRHAAKENK